MATRKKIPDNVVGDVMYASNRECIVCSNGKRGDQIHHIDGNNSNNKFENLAFLCFDCHNEAEIKGGLKKKLTPQAILKFKEHHYKVVEKQRNNKLKVFNERLGNNITTEELLSITKSAIIILELEKIKDDFYEASDWGQREKIINQLYKYSEHSNYRVVVDVYAFLYHISTSARRGMPADLAASIFWLAESFFPNYEKKADKEKITQVSLQCISIAYSLVSDSFLYLKQYDVAEYGFLILKLVYVRARTNKIKFIMAEVEDIYKSVESLLKGDDVAENNERMMETTKIFKEDLSNNDLSFPPDLKRYHIYSRSI